MPKNAKLAKTPRTMSKNVEISFCSLNLTFAGQKLTCFTGRKQITQYPIVEPWPMNRFAGTHKPIFQIGQTKSMTL